MQIGNGFAIFVWKFLPSKNGLVQFTEEGRKKKLIASWEIKENAKWGDGKPVTGHDVKLGWEIGKSPNVEVGDKHYYSRIEDIMVDPKNPKKFKIKFESRLFDHYQLESLNFVPHHLEADVWEKTKNQPLAYGKQTKYTTDPTNPGLYSGPYIVQDVKLGSHVVLTRNPHFYDKPAKIEKVIVRLVQNTQTLEANLLSGTIDMANEISMTLDQALAFEKRMKKDSKLSKRFDVRFRPGLVYEHIDLNLKNPDLQDVRVRQALVYAIDRDKMVQAFFEGRQKKAIHSIHPDDIYFTDDVQKYPHDPKKAGELLDAAGWKLGKDGYRRKGNKRLSFTIMTTSANKTRENIQVFLQQEWKKIGVDIKIKNQPGRVFFGETVRKSMFPAMAMYATVSSPDNPPRSLYAFGFYSDEEEFFFWIQYGEMEQSESGCRA